MRSPPENEEFRQALDGVEPIAPPRRVLRERARPAPLAHHSRRDERAVLAESLHGPLSIEDALESGEELVYLKDGYSRDLLRKLRRGHWVVEASLDLHGMNRPQAYAAVSEFLKTAAGRGARCVRIVHGKGLGSRNREPVLKGKLRKWLPMRAEVLAFCQAPSAEGGAGAALVLLKNPR
jgi:DNA-nicking Smr family endonuclease